MNDLILPEDALNRFQKPDAALLGLEIAAQEYALTRYGFRVGDIGLLITEDTLCEVMKKFLVYPIPNTKKWIPGIVNLRGNLIPVCDLRLLLELSDTPMKHQNLLILDKGPMSIGILVDNVPQPCDMKSWDRLDYLPEIPSGLTEYVNDAYSAADQVWLGFEHKKFFEAMRGSVAR